MKHIFPLLVLLAFSSVTTAAEDGTGQGKSVSSYDNYMIDLCSQVLDAEDGTGQGKAEDGTGQGKAEDGTGQNKAEDGTGQGKFPADLVNQCKVFMLDM
jgi:hypothetical protein